MRTIILVVAVACVAMVAVQFAWGLTPPPRPASIRLAIADGSMAGAIKRNLTTLASTQSDLALDFGATTYANQTDASVSVLPYICARGPALTRSVDV